MTVRKILLATGVAALMSTPQAIAWAHPGQGSGKGAEHSVGDSHGKHGTSPSNDPAKGKGANPGQSHRCTPHSVGYVAGGTLVSDSLTKNADGSYSGELVVEVTHTNHHAAADKGKKVTYTLTNAHLTLAVSDANKDGSVGIDDLVTGDRTHVIGRITTLRHNCSQTEFKATTTVRHVVFHDAKPPLSKH
ncbi:MAG TPA: hypothetical protein VGY30_10165 [Solirubrobacteraceae bacterium]|jgi:hypothetical protein|nr:hypothetical protein [Solirubrobacteraceae bacterium]